MNEDRRGYSLLELIVVMLVSVVVMGTAVGLIHQSMRAASVFRERSKEHDLMVRLSRTLRDEVAAGVSMQREGQTLSVKQNSATANFEIQESLVLLRRQHENGTESQELFALPAGVNAKWDESQMPERIALTLRKEHQGAIEGLATKPLLKSHVLASINRAVVRNTLGGTE